jgi:hypothetical protein
MQGMLRLSFVVIVLDRSGRNWPQLWFIDPKGWREDGEPQNTYPALSPMPWTAVARHQRVVE